MFKISLLSGTRFNFVNEESILLAAEKAGIVLPNSCRDGRCNSCRCQVISGNTRAIKPEFGITKEDIQLGWILSCARVPDSDIVIDVEDISEYNLIKPSIYPCKIQSLHFFKPDILQVYLRLPRSSEFRFIPGQYVDILASGGIKRSYSIASGDTKSGAIELNIKKNEGGQLSKYWFESAKVGDFLRLHGPLGSFFLRNFDDVDLVFLATGTGIAPVKSMLEYLSNLPESRRPGNVSVYWGARFSNDFYIDLDSFDWVTYIPVISGLEPGWNGSQGYVQDVFLANTKDISKVVVYACGSSLMVNSSREKLFGAGLLQTHFFADPFLAA